MGRFLTIILFSMSICGVAAQVQAPSPVRKFYSGIVKMTDCDKQMLTELELDMEKCFCGDESSGINLPNDFRHFEVDKNTISHNLDILTSSNYINKLSKYANEEKVLRPHVEVSTYSQKVGSLPEFGNNRMTSSSAYISTIVRKKYTFVHNGRVQSKEFIDTVYTHEAMNRIRAIYNGNGSATTEDLDKLRIDAAKAYGDGRYHTAYEIFTKIAQSDKADSETYYRLALMTFYGKGCKKDRRRGKNLMTKASVMRPYFYSQKADIVLKNWQMPNML